MNIKDKVSNPYYDASIQKSIKKLISEEWYAGQMYKLFITAVSTTEKANIADILDITAEDELEDHMVNLIKVARKYGYDVPSTPGEFKKYAGEKDSEAFETFKSKKDAETYLKLSIESEKRAIASYQEALDNDKLQICPEVSIVFTNNYYDELDHYAQFDFLYKTIAVDADVEIIKLGN